MIVDMSKYVFEGKFDIWDYKSHEQVTKGFIVDDENVRDFLAQRGIGGKTIRVTIEVIDGE